MNGWRRLWALLREFNATQIELQEHLLLLNSPWEEEFMRWAYDGNEWQLPATGQLHPMADATA